MSKKIFYYYADPLFYIHLSGHYPPAGVHRANSIFAALKEVPYCDAKILLPGEWSTSMLSITAIMMRKAGLVRLTKYLVAITMLMNTAWAVVYSLLVNRSKQIIMVTYNYPTPLLPLIPMFAILKIPIIMNIEDITEGKAVIRNGLGIYLMNRLRTFAMKVFISASSGIIAPYPFKCLSKFKYKLAIIPYIYSQ